MSRQLSIDTASTAVLCMDYQASIVSNHVKDQEIIARAQSVLSLARSRGMTVIYVKVGFRPNMPEVGRRNVLFGPLKASEQRQKLFNGPGGEIHEAVAPEGDDIVVTKHRVGAFMGTDLDMILRAKEIETLVLFGIATSGVVLSTLRYAADADYRLVVIKDCCADQNAEVHTCLVDKVFPRQATVVTASEFLDALNEAGS
jgi:nicotinamidase-related amidase